MVYASQRAIARLRMGFWRRKPSRARLGRLARLQDRASRPWRLGPRLSRKSLSQAASQLHLVGQSQRSEEHTSELQSRLHLVCRLLLEKKNNIDPLDAS